jgi:tetratricopeptide (TPR) repeat protein
VFDGAFALYQGGDFDAAKIGFERGLGIDPGNGSANFYLGDILARRGDRAAAEVRNQRAIFFDPDSPEGLKAQAATTRLAVDREKTLAERRRGQEEANRQAEREAKAAARAAENGPRNITKLRELRIGKELIDDAKCASPGETFPVCFRYRHETRDEGLTRQQCIQWDEQMSRIRYAHPADIFRLWGVGGLGEACVRMKHVIRSLHQSVEKEHRLTSEARYLKEGLYPFATWALRFPRE